MSALRTPTLKVIFPIVLVLILTCTFVDVEKASANEGADSEFYIFVGLAMPFFDLSQFDDDLNTVDLDYFIYDGLSRFGFGADFYFGKHTFIIFDHFDRYTILARNNHTTVDLTLNQGGITPGYGYRFASWFSVHTQVGIVLGDSRYTIVSGSKDSDPPLNGNMYGNYFALQPEGGVTFHIPWDLAIRLYGGYDAVLVQWGEKYSGDFEEGNFDELDLSHPVGGLELMFRFPFKRR